MNLRNAFYFDGKSSLDFGLYISGDQTFNAPEKEVEKVSIPGRSGDLIISHNRYKNINYSYKMFLADDLDHKSRQFKSWILSREGYCRLEDDYHPEEFRLAHFAGPIDFDVILLTAGTTNLTFDCKPQRFLKIGENEINVSSNLSIYNPTYEDSKPLIKVTGTGSFVMNGTTVTVTQNNGNLIIDSDIEQAYEGSVYRNGTITLSNNQFPLLSPGDNAITLSGVTLKVTPRWFML